MYNIIYNKSCAIYHIYYIINIYLICNVLYIMHHISYIIYHIWSCIIIYHISYSKYMIWYIHMIIFVYIYIYIYLRIWHVVILVVGKSNFYACPQIVAPTQLVYERLHVGVYIYIYIYYVIYYEFAVYIYIMYYILCNPSFFFHNPIFLGLGSIVFFTACLAPACWLMSAWVKTENYPWT
jgi:hypothetical protein